MKRTMKAKAKTVTKKRGAASKQKHLVEGFAQDLKEAFAKGYANAVEEVLTALQKLSAYAGNALGKQAKKSKKAKPSVKAAAGKRGRPRKNKEVAVVDTTAKKRRGRPPKNK